MTERRFDRRRRLGRMADKDPRVPRAPGRTLGPERRLRGLVDVQPDDGPGAGLGLGAGWSLPFGRMTRRLGPKGRFLAAAVVIGAAITAGSVLWDRWSNDRATAADHANTAQVALGRSLYDQHCAFCHGEDLAGKPGWDGDHPSGGRPPPPLDGSGAIARLGDRDLFDVTKFGGQPFSPPDYRNGMPGFEGRLSDADIWAILAFVKSRWPDAVRERQKELASERGG